MKKLLSALLLLGVLGLGVFWVLTGSNALSDQQLAGLPVGDAKAGERMFWAGGCASCHAAPGAKGDAKLVLTGGVELKTPFGTFVAPNISPDANAGIGAWTVADFVNAMKRGISPEGEHYYPAFPYTSYARMTDKDVVDLFAYLKSLKPDDTESADNKLAFPFNIRRGLGLWKRLYLSDQPVMKLADATNEIKLGQYLVEGAAHCGACHTPRNPIGGLQNSRWLSGAISAEGEGKIPNITPHADGIASWSAAEIADSLETGFTPSFDSFGSTMADVQENMSKLPKVDRDAIAAYLKAIPPVSGKP